MKRCSRCTMMLPFSEFHRHANTPDGLQGVCKTCKRPMSSECTRKARERRPEINNYRGMRERCNNPKHIEYHRYGAKGISVCERWSTFKVFFEDMGPRPSPSHSIDRINAMGNYEPSNCRWATPKEQAANSRRRQPSDKCRRGHVFTNENTYTAPSGKRFCRACRKLKSMGLL
jgi:hypothetical protein